MDGHYEVNRQTRTLDWQLPIIDASNKQGSLEFSIAGDDVNAFYPVRVAFISEKPFCDVDVSVMFLYNIIQILQLSQYNLLDLGFGNNSY